jgi:hypothetical protein
MTTIINNINPSLLNDLKKVKNSMSRFSELEKLIKLNELKNYELAPNQLKAILFLFPELDRFNAFERLVKNFNIKLSDLSEPVTNDLNACLSRDPAFNKLLPFAKKNFGGIFLTKQNDEKIVSILKQKEIKDVSNILPRAKPKQSSKQSPSKPANRNKLSQLRLLMMQECPESRLNFFRCSETKNDYQALIAGMKIEEFKNFIELFPPKDAIKFLNIPLIKNQIEGFHRQNCQLAEDSCKDLLNYFKENDQKGHVKRLLRPIISPEINKKLTKQGLFKVINEKREHQRETLPDIVSSHTISRAG